MKRFPRYHVLSLAMLMLCPAWVSPAADTNSKPNPVPTPTPALMPGPVVTHDKPAPFSQAEILKLMHLVNDWQKAHPTRKPEDRGWIRAIWYAGVIADYKATGDQEFLQQALAWGEQHQWQMGQEKNYAANNLFASQVWAELYFLNEKQAMLAPTETWFKRPDKFSPAGTAKEGTKFWYTPDIRYVDTLYGSAALAMFGAATVNQKDESKYFDVLHQMFWDVTGELWDNDAHLYYRDHNFIGKKSTGGRKVLWGRGNGWAIAAIVRIMQYLPQNNPDWPRYAEKLKQMAGALAECQRNDGMWSPNLDDPTDADNPETSASGLICYGLAWGVNHGILDQKTYLPVVKKAWVGLTGAITDDGAVCWCQPVGHFPLPVPKEQVQQEYGAGAVMLAASEIYRLSNKLDADGNLLPESTSNLISVNKIADHPFGAQIQSVLDRQANAPDFKPTGLDKNEYLRIIASQVHAFRKQQDANGRIIDPVRKAEWHYTTPMYAHAASIICATGYDKDPSMLESAMKAMDVAVSDLAGCDQSIPGRASIPPGVSKPGTSDFYIWPLMMAYAQFEKVAPADRLETWRKELSGLEPAKAYTAYNSIGGNWTWVHAGGEYLRVNRGWTSGDYVDHVIDIQKWRMTPEGQYREHGSPFVYDAFSRYFLSGMLTYGYHGEHFDFLREVCWKGAWTSLMTQSPFGEMATGYRSAQHIWNEAEIAATYEMYATAYAKAGRPMEAGAFKRGAHLALQSVGHWIGPDGWGYLVKNHYPPEAQHGFEGYSIFACYNLQSCSMLATAWSVADDSVAEQPAPADLGGFVLPIPEFNMVVANAAGAYVEYMTCGNQRYDPTGLIRIHLRDGNPQLGPSCGAVQRFGTQNPKVMPEINKKLGLAIPQPWDMAKNIGVLGLCVGPAWENPDGTEVRLADFSDPTGEDHVVPASEKGQAPIQMADPVAPSVIGIKVLEQSPKKASFQASVALQNANVSETIVLADGHVEVTDQWDTTLPGKLRIYYPALITNGAFNTKIDLTGNQVTLIGEDGRGINFRVVEPAGAEIKRSGQTMPNRNGVLEALTTDVEGNKAVYQISPAPASH